MALETRPIPVLKGKVLKDFLKTLSQCTVSESREEVQEINRWTREMIEESRRKEEARRLERQQQKDSPNV
jgi:hypothetical protein